MKQVWKSPDDATEVSNQMCLKKHFTAVGYIFFFGYSLSKFTDSRKFDKGISFPWCTQHFYIVTTSSYLHDKLFDIQFNLNARNSS